MRRAYSLDLGTQQDYTAASYVEYAAVIKEKAALPGTIAHDMEDRIAVYEHRLRFLERAEKGTSYPDIIKTTRMRLSNPDIAGAELIVDATGVGIAVLQQMRHEGLNPIGINSVTVYRRKIL